MRSIDEVFARADHWVDGGWLRPHGKERIAVEDPATELILGHVAAGDEHDINQAVQAAHRALPGWREVPLERRLSLLDSLCDVLEGDQETLSQIVTAEVGAPISISGPLHVGLAIEILRAFVKLGDEFEFESASGNSRLFYEPVGVAGCITPWNLPLVLVVQKLGAALVAGCTTVFKPSEMTPFSAFRLAECIAEAGYPPGVFNVVTGDGPSAGEPLVTHPLVRKVSFTGSTRAGRRVAALAAQDVKRVGLELGGKSANLVLPDGDLQQAVETGTQQACFNAGQSCIAWSRLLVPANKLKEATEIAAAAMERMVVGSPNDPETQVGPLISADAASKVRDYIASGVAAGAVVATGGLERPDGQSRGHYVQPTVLTNVNENMSVAQDEIFGPVLCVIPYSDEEEAVRIANGTPYGLHGAVWSRDEERAVSFARRLETGMVNVNGYGFDATAPFGGYKQSGVGREMGFDGIREFLEVKAVQTFDLK